MFVLIICIKYLYAIECRLFKLKDLSDSFFLTLFKKICLLYKKICTYIYIIQHWEIWFFLVELSEEPFIQIN